MRQDAAGFGRGRGGAYGSCARGPASSIRAKFRWNSSPPEPVRARSGPGSDGTRRLRAHEGVVRDKFRWNSSPQGPVPVELVVSGPQFRGTRRPEGPAPWNSPPLGPSSVELAAPRAQLRGTRRPRQARSGPDQGPVPWNSSSPVNDGGEGYLLWATIGNRPSSPIKACRDFGIKLAERSVPCIYVNTERLLRGDFLISCWRGQEMHPGGRTGGLAKLGHPSLYFLRHGDARPASSAFQLFKPFSRRGGLSML